MLTDEKLKAFEELAERAVRYGSTSGGTKERIIDPLINEIRTLQQQNKQLVEALEFYAEEYRYLVPNPYSDYPDLPEICFEKGSRARKTIQGDKS